MNEQGISRGLDGKQEPQNRSEAAGQQGGKVARNADSLPAEEGERQELEMAAPEQAQPSEQIIDEAVEGTFPASDPPFWMPSGL